MASRPPSGQPGIYTLLPPVSTDRGASRIPHHHGRPQEELVVAAAPLWRAAQTPGKYYGVPVGDFGESSEKIEMV